MLTLVDACRPQEGPHDIAAEVSVLEHEVQVEHHDEEDGADQAEVQAEDGAKKGVSNGTGTTVGF